MKKNRILYISVCNGGSDKALINMLDGLSQSDIQPFVLINSKSGLHNVLTQRKIPFFLVRYKFDNWPKSIFFKDKLLYPWRLLFYPIINWFASYSVKRICKRNHIDLIHTNVGVYQFGYNVAKKLNIPHVWHLREYQDLDFNMHPFPSKKSYLTKLHSPLNNSIAITQGIFDHFKLNSHHSSVIYDGVFSSVSQSSKLEKGNYFLFVGRITANKGITDIIDSFIKFAILDFSTELWIVETLHINEYTKSIIAKIDAAGLKDRVKFLGYRKDVYKLMSSAIALIVGSKFEGFGFITAEAMFNNCLVIGRNTAGTKEQFDNGVTFTGNEIGLRYQSQLELTALMVEVVNYGSEHYSQMLSNAKKTVTALYSNEVNAIKVTSFYNQIISNKLLK